MASYSKRIEKTFVNVPLPSTDVFDHKHACIVCGSPYEATPTVVETISGIRSREYECTGSFRCSTLWRSDLDANPSRIEGV